VDVVSISPKGSRFLCARCSLTGLHYTRPDTIAKAITLHPGDPLNETALDGDTAQSLTIFALFNEIDTAVENPNRGETLQDRLLQCCG